MSRDPLGRTNRVRYTRSKDDKLASMPDDWNEGIDDRINAILVAGDNVTLTYDDVANSLTIAASGGAPGSLTDGDKGDITVSASGATWTVDAGAITLAKMADMATSSLIYRKTAGTGVPEVQTLATLKTDLGLTGTNSGDQTTIVGITGTKAQFDTAVTDGNFLYVGDVTSNATHTGEVTGSTALTVDKTAITGKTLVTAAVGDQVLVADASDSDNLKRVTVQTIVDLASGGATNLTYTAATRVIASDTGTDATLPLVTSGDAGLAPASGGGTSNFLRADGTWAAPSGGSTIYYGHLQSDYTLTSQTAAQKLFNWSTNGALTLPTGVYRFRSLIYLTTMSATSGNGAFQLVGSGTATVARILYQTVGIDNTTPLAAAAKTGVASVTSASPASMVTAGTGTGLVAQIEGFFDVTVTGTIIPSIALVTANAAVVKAGSFFECERVGNTATATSSGWS
jgi:hypothetical protein